jgi:hypothetical protein
MIFRTANVLQKKPDLQVFGNGHVLEHVPSVPVKALQVLSCNVRKMRQPGQNSAKHQRNARQWGKEWKGAQYWERAQCVQRFELHI